MAQNPSSRSDGCTGEMQLYTPRNILVTGGAGFIASNTIRFMMGLYPDYNFVVLDKFDRCTSVKNLGDLETQLTVVRGDIRSADLVSHLIASHKAQALFFENPVKTFEQP